MNRIMTLVLIAVLFLTSPLPASAGGDPETCANQGGRWQNGSCTYPHSPPAMDLFGWLIVGAFIIEGLGLLDTDKQK